MAGAAGGFVTRAFESMLKEASSKKLTSLQPAIQSYLGLAFFLNSNFFFLFISLARLRTFYFFYTAL